MQRAFGVAPLSILLLASDVILIAAGLWLSSVIRLALPYGQAIDRAGATVPGAVFLLAEISWVSALAGWGAYNPRSVLRWYQEAARVTSGAVTGTILMGGGLYLSFRDISRLQFFYFLIVALGLILTARALLRIYYRLIGKSRPGWRERVLIVGAGDLGRRAAQVLMDQSRWGYSLLGFLDDDPAKRGGSVLGHPVLAPLDGITDVASSGKADEVWICLPGRSYDRIQWVVSQLERQPVRIKIAPDYFSMALVRARPEILGGIPLIGLREPLIEGWTRLVKRTFDLIVGGGLTVFLLPLLILVALAIRLGGPGPIWIRQMRAGENGRPFGMFKFRSMVPQAEEHPKPATAMQGDPPSLHKIKDDPRVTRVGRFLRRYSLDELPQLFNVLKGEMSLVGPRPELPWLVDRYEPWQRKRFAVPQGLTGWWQINGRSDKPMHLNTEDDLYYVYNYSLWLDVLILLRTPLAVLRGQGAF